MFMKKVGKSQKKKRGKGGAVAAPPMYRRCRQHTGVTATVTVRSICSGLTCLSLVRQITIYTDVN